VTDPAPAKAPYIDALNHSRWSRELFMEWRDGGIDAVHVTCALWEDARTTLDTLGRWNRRFREEEDLIALAASADDIEAARASGRTAVILGFQTSSPIEDDLDLVEVWHQLGVRIIQLTYNSQTLIGAGCYEADDSGLTRFGREVVREMNRVGILIDLSHVGERTSLDAIEASQRAVSITHANPRSFFDHVRNKRDHVMRALAERGGVLGCTIYPPLMGGRDVSLEAWTEMVAGAVDLIGIDHVGIGSDASRDWDDKDLKWVRLGRWTHDESLGRTVSGSSSWPEWPAWFVTPAHFPNIRAGLERRGFGSAEVGAIMGGNWLRLFRESFGPS
jgi:microsomal dipeptidase-like Zn-dependent dipeptidase